MRHALLERYDASGCSGLMKECFLHSELSLGGNMDVISSAGKDVVANTLSFDSCTLSEHKFDPFRHDHSPLPSYNYSAKGSNTDRYLEADELAQVILHESPEVLEAFDSPEEMVEYIREAIAANYQFRPQ